jgi:hypothetical protein
VPPPCPQALFGPSPANPLVAQVQAAAAAGDWGALGAHLAASAVVGPLWEEVRPRGGVGPGGGGGLQHHQPLGLALS